MRAVEILPGDRISCRRADGKVAVRSVLSVGLDYVKVLLDGRVRSIPEHRILSFERHTL